MQHLFNARPRRGSHCRSGHSCLRWKGMNEDEFDWCIRQTLFFGEERQPLT